MRIVSWNVNGVRALDARMTQGGFADWLVASDADVVCVQEHKVTVSKNLDDGLLAIPGWSSFWAFSQVKSGQCGVATFARTGTTLSAEPGFGFPSSFADAGRVMVTDHGAFVLINVYVPSSGNVYKESTGKDRVAAKMAFYTDLERKASAGFVCLFD